MYQEQLGKDIKKLSSQLGLSSQSLLITPTVNPQFGDYSTNIALQQPKQVIESTYQSVIDIANSLAGKIAALSYVEKAEVAGPGFINIFIKGTNLIESLHKEIPQGNDEEKILVEYASPNAAKPFHIGHLRNITIGESISRLLEYQGNTIFRANYSSDIGLPFAKTVWAVTRMRSEYEELRKGSIKKKVDFLGNAYVKGNEAYEKAAKEKDEIDQINKSLYQKDPLLMPLWQEIKSWSEGYFDLIYSRLGSEFDAILWESEVEEEGKQLVLDHINTVFKKDEQAVIFPGEQYGLHTRVFITSAGNPTYEAKELGLTRREQELFPFDKALHIVGNEQIDYFKVVIKAMELIDTDLKGKKIHLPYGFVTLSTGKMSSRLGNVITAEDLIEQVKDEVNKLVEHANLPSKSQIVEKIALSAIKFSYLKYAKESDISFDIEKSVSLQGDSGPYLQYTYVRTYALLSQSPDIQLQFDSNSLNLETEERELLRQLDYFPGVLKEAALNYQPNVLCVYLLTLAKAFNLFYQIHPILKSDKVVFRLALTKRVGEILQLGLYLLGIETVEKM